jgi:hypothetical protein
MAPAYFIIRLQNLGVTPVKPILATIVKSTKDTTIPNHTQHFTTMPQSMKITPPWDCDQEVTIKVGIVDGHPDMGLTLVKICWSEDTANKAVID